MKKQEIIETIQSRYDYIGREKAIEFILSINPRTNVNEIIEAWKEIYWWED